MNRRDYQVYQTGREAAAGGAGLSDDPHGGRDGDLWRRGVADWLDEHGDDQQDPKTAQSESRKV